MSTLKRKYIPLITSLVLWGYMVFGLPQGQLPSNPPQAKRGIADSTDSITIDNLRKKIRGVDSTALRNRLDSTPLRNRLDSTPLRGVIDSISQRGDSLSPQLTPLHSDSLLGGILEPVPRKRENKSMFDDVISGKNRDSLVYDVRNGMVYIYQEGDVTYQETNLKADYMEVDMESKDIYAYGVTDSLGNKSRPEFAQKGSTYTMDTITYNINSQKAKIKGVATQEGEGFLTSREIKRMADNSVNIAGGRYTTCDDPDHPHFYLAMTKAKMIPNKKIIIGPSYLVMEDVPIYFPLLPFGFFPMTSGRSSGFVIPSYGEEYVKGFFLRDGGYYFAFNDYIDLTVLGGFYTLGSWEASMSSRYIKKYKYSGGFNTSFQKNIIGEKEAEDYRNESTFSLQWQHTQDPKFRPNSTFSASVNLSTSGYSSYGAQNAIDAINSQSTSSTISYSKTWAGKPFNFAASFRHSQNSQNKTISLTLPDIAFGASRIAPFKRKNTLDKERWYEKITFNYSGVVRNSVTTKENELFTEEMLKKAETVITHSIPISTSLNLFGYLNITPSVNYKERWHLKRFNKSWSYEENAVVSDTTYGFYRVYDYSFSMSASTKLYGMYQFSEKSGLRAIRHVLSPTLSFSYTPDFGKPSYGYYKTYQTDASGTLASYSPYPGAPSNRKSMSMSFSLGQSLEMKVKSDKDTSGLKKVKLIDNFSLSSSYDFTRDQFKLSNINATLRTTIVKGFDLNVNATFDPYQLDEKGVRINKFMVSKGGVARLISASTGFNYTINPGKNSNRAAVNDLSSGGVATPEQNDMMDRQNIVDPNARRVLLASQYYDFSIPWNLGLNYTFSYSKPGLVGNVTQTMMFNGSVTFTQKWGMSFNGSYDFKERKMGFGTFAITRDLHCWQMNFAWTPMGNYKSWSFNISVKSNVLQDLKYDKRSSRYDNLID